ncbi:hypothetical protein HQ535_02495 [bacterium]|nr:hypothetical protein [bacterium]
MTTIGTLTRPAAHADHRIASRHRPIAFVLAFTGLMVIAVAAVVLWIAAGDVADTEALLRLNAIGFGLNTTGFAIIKLSIAVVLIGILIRLWLRVDSMKAALPALKAEGKTPAPRGDIVTLFGKATETDAVPEPLPIHRMAQTLWFPMLAIGAMAVVAGLITSWVWAGDTSSISAAAWTQGLQFLGEAFILSGIAFLLGSILASLREGGGAVQQSLGLSTQTLRMPTTAKVFVGLMMLGLMAGITQFALYGIVAAGVDNPAAWFAWLGPFREFSLAMILMGIVMALVTIGNVLNFQFNRIRNIITSGK